MFVVLVEMIVCDVVDGCVGEYDFVGFGEVWVDVFVEVVFVMLMCVKGGFYVLCKFIVGGGKKMWVKYDDEVVKYLMVALRVRGFEDDRGASACEAC